MDVPGQAVIDVLTYLLPGFITAAILYNLTPHPRPIPFERTVQALIFTILVQVGVEAARSTALVVGSLFAVGTWTDSVRLAWAVSLASALGLGLAFASNTDRLHGRLRKLGITAQTSYSSEWYGALAQNQGYVVLHLAGERRLYGWPEEWPSVPGVGHWVVALPQWLHDGEVIEAAGVEKVLVRAADVEMVELMEIAKDP